jgi:uncharacterized hydrophobic protein (TIGR00271 family)
MAIVLFDAIEEKDRQTAIKKLIEQSSPRQGFFTMIALSIAMAAFGLMMNSVSVIIGSMLIAPLLYPVLSLGLGIVLADHRLIARSGWTVIKSAAMGVILATILTWIFSDQSASTWIEEWVRTSATTLAFSVAVVAGAAASFAMVNPILSETLPGVAISAALIPPVAMIGVHLSRFNFQGALDASLLFIINILGIVIASVLMFSLMRLAREKTVVKQAITEDEREIKAEEKLAEQTEKEDEDEAEKEAIKERRKIRR